VNEIPLLGVIFSSDLKWNKHFDVIVKKACRRIYLMYNLVRANCPVNLLIRAYIAYIRSLLLYSFPTFCNASEYLLRRITGIEKRVVSLIGASLEHTGILSASEIMCKRLFECIESSPDHPLRVMFDTSTRSGRGRCKRRTLKAPFARTKRYSNSFIKFSRIS